MKLTGQYLVPVPRERAFTLLQDPDILCQCMPGCEGLEKVAADTYKMRMKMMMAAISGQFEGQVRISESKPPESFRLLVEGTGRIGFVKGSGLLTLRPEGGSTEVQFEGDVQVGGTIASVGQRLLDTTAKMMIKKFFDKLCTLAGDVPALDVTE